VGFIALAGRKAEWLAILQSVIGKSENWPITDWQIHHLACGCGLSGFGLRSASGESGAEGGEERLANRSRSATTRRRPADGSPPLIAAQCGCPLVTSARFAEWNGRRREGQGRRAVRGTQQTARWSRRIHISYFVSILCVSTTFAPRLLGERPAILQNDSQLEARRESDL